VLSLPQRTNRLSTRQRSQTSWKVTESSRLGYWHGATLYPEGPCGGTGVNPGGVPSLGCPCVGGRILRARDRRKKANRPGDGFVRVVATQEGTRIRHWDERKKLELLCGTPYDNTDFSSTISLTVFQYVRTMRPYRWQSAVLRTESPTSLGQGETSCTDF
jgi:hypothetical protein